MPPMDAVWDMETQDPDDFLTLLLLLGHPEVRLRAVTVTPGSVHQVGLVRRALGWFGADIPVGAGNLDHPKSCVSSWHERAYGEVLPSREAELAGEVLRRCCDEQTTPITGGPLKNLGPRCRSPGSAWGGWWSREVSPGRVSSPGSNSLRSSRAASPAPPATSTATRARPWRRSPSLASERGPRDGDGVGKMLHDPLAACCAIDEGVGSWAEVQIFRERGEWGARLRPGSGTWILTAHDRERFWSVLTRRSE